MAEPKFKIAFAIDAQEFLKSIPDSAREKIYYNIRRVLYGEINNELFKKLENSDGIWEFRTLYQKIAYRLFCLLGYRIRYADCCNARHYKENSKNSFKRNSKS